MILIGKILTTHAVETPLFRLEVLKQLVMQMVIEYRVKAAKRSIALLKAAIYFRHRYELLFCVAIVEHDQR